MTKMAACVSVRPSVKRVNYDKTKETSAHFLYHMKKRFFQHEEWFVGGNPLHLKF